MQTQDRHGWHLKLKTSKVSGSPQPGDGTVAGAGRGIDFVSEKAPAEIWNDPTWCVPHVQLDPVLVYLKAGCVVFKHGGQVALKKTRMTFREKIVRDDR